MAVSHFKFYISSYIYTFRSPLSLTNNNLFLFDIAGLFRCSYATDCPKQLCIRPLIATCIDFNCECDVKIKNNYEN